MNKEDRNNFQKCIEEILEDLNLGGHVTAEPLLSERTKESFDSYKDEAYYSLSPKKRKIVDMQQRAILMRMDRLMKTPSMMMLVKQQKSWQYFCEQFSIIRKKIQRN